MRSVFALTVLSATTMPFAAFACVVPGINLVADVTMPGYMYVKSGKRCSIVAESSSGGTKGVEITKRPVNGTLENLGLGVRYVSRPGFVGKDSFGYTRHSLDARTNRPVRFPVMVEVTVQK